MKRSIQTIANAAVSVLSPHWRDRMKSIPGIAPLQRLLVRYVLSGNEFVHAIDAGPAKGVRFPVRLPEDKGVWVGNYESHFADGVADCIAPGDICVDIGAWRGYFTAVMANCGASEVHVFEPNPENVKQIERLVSLNDSLPIVIHPIAVGRSSGTVEMELIGDTSMGKLASSSFQLSRGTVGTLTVDLTTLDQWVESTGLSRCSVVKMDVEGAELEVLEGASQVIATMRPTFCIEVHTPALMASITNLLGAADYRITRLPPAAGTAIDPSVTHIVAKHRAKG